MTSTPHDNPILVAIALFLFASVAISIGIEIARKKRKGRYKDTAFNEQGIYND